MINNESTNITNRILPDPCVYLAQLLITGVIVGVFKGCHMIWVNGFFGLINTHVSEFVVTNTIFYALSILAITSILYHYVYLQFFNDDGDL